MPADPSSDSLTIVIPALNEEDAIGQTITRCLEARPQIERRGGVSDVEIVVVSDGSTDRTAEIAQGFDEVKVIVFERNRGYGAAIKEGWRQGSGSLLGFIDADGTCDPNYFAEMCRRAREEGADIVLGSRLGPESRMPAIRRLGNRIYALLLGFLCGFQVTDTASGMRVVRRGALRHLYPLPDGLHFTPSMSARALLNGLRVIEIPMRYEERIGRSKLSVFRDGIRFLKTIISGVLCYRPEKIFLSLVALCLLGLVVLAAFPTEFYWHNRRLEEWMIYRFVVCHFLGSCALLLVLAAALANRMANLGPRRRQAVPFLAHFLASILQGWTIFAIALGLVALGLGLLWPGIVEYLRTGHITLHWSRLLAGAFALFSAFQTIVFAILIKTISIWTEHREFLTRADEDAEARAAALDRIGSGLGS